jgi:hypothetical protein
VQAHENSTTKNIGDHKGQGIQNKIDEADLKRSHLPFQRAYGDRSGDIAFRLVNSSNNSNNLAQAIKQASSISKIPFSPQMRVRSDDAPLAQRQLSFNHN